MFKSSETGPESFSPLRVRGGVGGGVSLFLHISQRLTSMRASLARHLPFAARSVLRAEYDSKSCALRPPAGRAAPESHRSRQFYAGSGCENDSRSADWPGWAQTHPDESPGFLQR